MVCRKVQLLWTARTKRKRLSTQTCNTVLEVTMEEEMEKEYHAIYVRKRHIQQPDVGKISRQFVPSRTETTWSKPRDYHILPTVRSYFHLRAHNHFNCWIGIGGMMLFTIFGAHMTRRLMQYRENSVLNRNLQRMANYPLVARYSHENPCYER